MPKWYRNVAMIGRIPWTATNTLGDVGTDAGATSLGKRLGYFVIIRLTGGGGAAAGEMTNVNQVFQPAGRAELPNSP